MFDLGTNTKQITTSSPSAQIWFDLGLNWLFGFNQEEAVACFRRCLDDDPECAMAYWGIAYGSGPFYNYPWRHFGVEELAQRVQICHENVELAASLAPKTTEVEQALIRALKVRFPAAHVDSLDQCDKSDDNYADAMRLVHQEFTDDHDVKALFAESLITRTPWRLWDVTTGEPAEGADTLEALEVCSSASRSHAGLLHMKIHTLEMSNDPELAIDAADQLATMCPDNGHLNHMPGHIYVLCGEYEKARLASLRAIAADETYVNHAGQVDFFTTNRCHDLHLMMYTCMLQGRYADALAAADRICEILTPEILGVEGVPQLAATLEGYYSMRMHVLVRFGRWQNIIDAPMPRDPELYCVSTAMYHYAKGIAAATLGDFAVSQEHRRSFLDAVNLVPPTRRFFNNSATDVLGVGEKMLDGELAYHQGYFEAAFEHLREGVRRDDSLAYTEPWAWMHPPRHALAALLMEQGNLKEAEMLYRADLGLDDTVQRCSQHPRNVWSLHGLVECLTKRGETVRRDDLQSQLTDALAEADVLISSSCMCSGVQNR